jgi:hypothetical protein
MQLRTKLFFLSFERNPFTNKTKFFLKQKKNLIDFYLVEKTKMLYYTPNTLLLGHLFFFATLWA